MAQPHSNSSCSPPSLSRLALHLSARLLANVDVYTTACHFQMPLPDAVAILAQGTP